MIQFWLRESRTPSMLTEVSQKNAEHRLEAARYRSWLSVADLREPHLIEKALVEEEQTERTLDEEYWRPLKQELIELRLLRSRHQPPNE